MALTLTQWITIVYASLNTSITLFVSILGVIYIRDEVKRRKLLQETTVATVIAVHDTVCLLYTSSSRILIVCVVIILDLLHEQELKEEAGDTKTEIQDKVPNVKSEHELNKDGVEEKDEIAGVIVAQNDKEVEERLEKLSKMGFVKLWGKLVWKMRSCYLSLVVHLFDVLTDILVIVEWWHLEDDGNDINHVDSRLMAWCGIGVLLMHKVVSTFAFWMKDKNLYRSMLQFLDLLIFEEIHSSHKKIVSQFKNHGDYEKAVESTTSFKYIRSLEAIWESIPQSVLQMVFLIRTGGDYGGDKLLLAISILSIFQSIVSMTNSILKQDNLYMDLPKFKKHRRRLPPTFEFFKHALCRFSEVFYRIALLSIFWAVCGGEMFSILLGVELFFVIMCTLTERFAEGSELEELNVDEVFLRLQCLVILPTEMVFAETGQSDAVNCGFIVYNDDEMNFDSDNPVRDVTTNFIATLCCCYIPAALLTSCCCTYGREDHYLHPRIRIGISMMEWLIIIPIALNEDEADFVFDSEYGLAIFIIGLLLFIVSSQYLYLMPRFVMPHSVSIRSKWGYAFNGELEELKRMVITADRVNEERKRKAAELQMESDRLKQKCNEIRNKIDPIGEKRIYDLRRESAEFMRAYLEWDNVLDKFRKIKMGQNYWDDRYFAEKWYIERTESGLTITQKKIREDTSPAMFALANAQYDVVLWLEEQGAVNHKKAVEDSNSLQEKTKTARKHMDIGYGSYRQ